MINTLNETHLHKTLKELYMMNDSGSQAEQKVGNYIADIVASDGSIIEIQTGSVSHLLKKCLYFFSMKRKVRIVYPLVIEKYVETTNTVKETTSRRKSPKKNNIYSMFREITGLCPILLDSKFTLDVVEVTVTEHRLDDGKLKQSHNGSRRFRKTWIKTGKSLETMGATHTFHGKKGWKALLPKGLEDTFTSTQFYQAVLERDGDTVKPKASRDQINLMLWVYTHMGLIEYVGKQGRMNLYRLA